MTDYSLGRDLDCPDPSLPLLGVVPDLISTYTRNMS